MLPRTSRVEAPKLTAPGAGSSWHATEQRCLCLRLPEQGVVWHEKMLFGMCVMFFFSFFSACLAFTDVVWHVLSSDLGYLVHTNLESLIVSVFSQWLHFVIDILMPSKRRISVKN